MAEGGDASRSRLARWTGLLELSLRRIWNGIRSRGLSRVLVAVAVVAIAVAVLMVVTGLSLGLASQPAVDDPGMEYWIAPESATTLTTLTAAEGPQLGDVHERSAALEAHDEIERATPILVEVLEIRTDPQAEAEYILAIGIIPPADGSAIAGVSTEALTAGDPNHGDGDGDAFTGEVVLSPAAGDLLSAEGDESLLITRPGPGAVDQSFSVTAVSETESRTVQGEAPIALFQLSELQAFTGADSGDQADQILVRADSEAAVPILEDTYTSANVVERGSISGDRAVNAELPLAISLSALLIVLLVMTLVITTTAGIDVEADRRQLAVFAALGMSSRSTTTLVATRTLMIAALGGVVGTVLGSLGIIVLNRVIAPYYELAAFAILTPTLAAYGIGIAVLAGLLAVPYPLVLARRIPTLQELTR